MPVKAFSLFLLLLAGLLQPVFAAGLATLFTTSEERALIDRNRYKTAGMEVEQQPVENIDDTDAMRVEPASYDRVTRKYTISGITVSHAGPHTVWINSVAYEDGARLDDDSRIKVLEGAEIRVRITAPDGRQYYATSGETLEISILVPAGIQP